MPVLTLPIMGDILGGQSHTKLETKEAHLGVRGTGTLTLGSSESAQI